MVSARRAHKYTTASSPHRQPAQGPLSCAARALISLTLLIGFTIAPFARFIEMGPRAAGAESRDDDIVEYRSWLEVAGSAQVLLYNGVVQLETQSWPVVPGGNAASLAPLSLAALAPFWLDSSPLCPVRNLSAGLTADQASNPTRKPWSGDGPDGSAIRADMQQFKGKS